ALYHRRLAASRTARDERIQSRLGFATDAHVRRVSGRKKASSAARSWPSYSPFAASRVARAPERAVAFVWAAFPFQVRRAAAAPPLKKSRVLRPSVSAPSRAVRPPVFAASFAVRLTRVLAGISPHAAAATTRTTTRTMARRRDAGPAAVVRAFRPGHRRRLPPRAPRRYRAPRLPRHPHRGDHRRPPGGRDGRARRAADAVRDAPRRRHGGARRPRARLRP